MHLDEIERASYLGSNLIPVRYTLGFRAAGTSAWAADTGGQLIPPHTEDAGSEEMYVVVRGRAKFTVGEEKADVPAGAVICGPPGGVPHGGGRRGRNGRAGRRGKDRARPSTVASRVGGQRRRRRTATRRPRRGRPRWYYGRRRGATQLVGDGLRLRAAGRCSRTIRTRRSGVSVSARRAEPRRGAPVHTEGDSDLDPLRDDPHFEELTS